MSDDTYFFEVSVAEHPQTKKRMNDLAKSVLDAQAEMSKAVSLVGTAADASVGKIGSMFDGLKSLETGGVQSLKALQEEVRALQELSKQKIVQSIEVQRTGSSGGDALGSSSSGQSTSGLSDYSDALQDSHVKDKAVWEAKVQSQKVAFEKAAADYDAAIQVQNKSSDEMNKAALKGARGLIDAAKGWAQLGLVGEENSKKLVEGLVLVEGAFNIAKGGVEFLEAFGQGWKAVRSSQEAANNISKITASLRSAEFAQLRAYHLSLVQEAQAASVAAAANGRLAASRSAAGMAAGRGAAVGAVGTAATAVGGAVSTGGAVVGGAGAVAGAAPAAAAWNTIGGVALGGAATLGVFVAAVAGAGFGLRALADLVSGAGNKVGSFNDTIASWEAGVGASMLNLTGMFNSLDAPGTQFAQSLSSLADSTGMAGTLIAPSMQFLAGALGDFATLAASQNELARAEQNAKKIRIDADKKFADERVKRDGGNQMARASFENRNAIRSIDAGDDKSAQLAAATAKRLDAAKMLAEQMRIMGDEEAKNLKHGEAYIAAEKEALKYRKDLASAITEQGRLQSDITAKEIDGQRKLQDEIKRKIDENRKGLESLESKQQGAVENFAKMDKLSQAQAIDALTQARAQGGGSLNDKQKELLRSVGTDEARQLAAEGDKREAADAGFANTFGSGFEAERTAIANTQKSLEAELNTKFDFTIKTESNLQQMLDSLKDAAKSTISDENKKAIEAVQRLVRDELVKNQQTTDQKLRTFNKA